MNVYGMCFSKVNWILKTCKGVQPICYHTLTIFVQRSCQSLQRCYFFLCHRQRKTQALNIVDNILSISAAKLTSLYIVVKNTKPHCRSKANISAQQSSPLATRSAWQHLVICINNKVYCLSFLPTNYNRVATSTKEK